MAGRLAGEGDDLHRPHDALRRRHAGARAPALRQGAPPFERRASRRARPRRPRPHRRRGLRLPDHGRAGGQGARRLGNSRRLRRHRLSRRPLAAKAAARGDPLRGRRGRKRDRHRHHPRPRPRPRLERALRRGRGDARSVRARASEGDPRHGGFEDAAQRLRRQHGRDAGGGRLHQDLDRQGGRQRHASGEPGDGSRIARLSRARRRRHRLQAGGRPAQRPRMRSPGSS